MEDELIWRDDPTAIQDSEWTRISSNHTNAGYREGITAGKESALQQGFDEGYAQIGVPIGRELGILRGIAFALLSYLTMSGTTSLELQVFVPEVRAISYQLSEIRFSDIAPLDLEAEQHAREHFDAEGDRRTDDDTEIEVPEELKDKQDMEKLEDMMVQMSTGSAVVLPAKRPTMEDVRRLKEQLLTLSVRLGLSMKWS